MHSGGNVFIMRTVFWTLLVGMLLVIALRSEADAADFKVVPKSDTARAPFGCDLYLSGEIMVGDAEKLKTLLGDRYGQKGDPITACLNSPGGVFEEGLELAKLFIARRVATKILANQECKSACAVAFMTGMTYSTGGSELGRTMHATARLGFHAPEPKLVAGTFDIDDLQNAYAKAVEGVGIELLALARRRDRAWDNQLIKSALINEMMIVHGAANFYFIDTVRKATEFQIDIDGTNKYRGFSIDDSRNACENAIAIGTDSVLADWFFQNEIQKITQKKNKDGQVMIIDIRRHKDVYCEVSKATEGNLVIRYNTSGGEHTVGLESWMALPGDTPLSKLSLPRVLPADTVRPAWCNSTQNDAVANICNSRELLKSDARVADLYRKALLKANPKERTTLQRNQRDWIVARNACKKDYICLNSKYVEHIFDLDHSTQ
jgi:ATP-dependent protease ClpP protease subunit